jgi:hypothetical protein
MTSKGGSEQRTHGCSFLRVGRRDGARCNEADYMCIVAKPAMPGHFEQVCTLSWVRDKYPFEQITSVRCDVFGERERRGHNVLVQKVYVVAFGIGWIVVEGEIACQHGVLRSLVRGIRCVLCVTYQNNTATPYVDFAASV